MGVDRRKFLKIAGLTTAVGMGAEVANAAAETHTSWAMAIDLDKCTKKEGCEDCIHACHSVHNVPDVDEVRHEVKWIWKEGYEHTFPSQENEFIPESLVDKHVLVACNHCQNPPCTRVCPTQATWKREKDGIVMMDWHRCIGCRYCVVACPYGSRSFNWQDPRKFLKKSDPGFPTRAKGVVEKCTFCAERRLEEGEEPACVSACKEGAMVFGNLEDPNSEIRKLLASRFSIRRKPGLGTQPHIFYLV